MAGAEEKVPQELRAEAEEKADKSSQQKNEDPRDCEQPVDLEEESGQELTEEDELRIPTREEYEALQEELELMSKENEELSHMLLRLRADFDNYRRRMQREKAKISEQALFNFIQQLLPVVDNLERALEAAEVSEAGSFVQGVEMIHRQLLEVMKREGVSLIEAEGQPFDPNIHEAIGKEEKEGYEPNTVIEVVQKGYKLNERVLRASKVKVSC
ncbi:MAG: nucleotide exchange factor GrpE [Firmicutes bacterium]|nr:nucleotide exchange factor GrpE [Bacillota bacterium]